MLFLPRRARKEVDGGREKGNRQLESAQGDNRNFAGDTGKVSLVLARVNRKN